MKNNYYYVVTMPNGEKKQSTELVDLITNYVVTIDDVLSYFNEIYGKVTTPTGEVYMGALMNSFLDEEEKYGFIQDFAFDLTTALMADEWDTNDQGNRFIEYENYIIEQVYLGNEIGKAETLCNAMEGYW